MRKHKIPYRDWIGMSISNYTRDEERHAILNGASLKAKMLIIILPVVMLCLLSVSVTSYFYINRVIEKEIAASMLSSVGKSAESINRWLKTLMIEPETIASTPSAKNINVDFRTFDTLNINRHKVLHKKYPDIFQDIYASNSEGVYHAVQRIGDFYSIFVGDISNRPYFISIMAGGSTQITPPLISRTTGIPTIFMVAPIQDELGEPLGLIGTGISLQYIQEIAKGLKAGETGYSFIVGQDGAYIYHPDSDFVMKMRIIDRESPSENKLGELMLSGTSGIYSYKYNDEKMVAFYQPVPVAGWSVATVLPEDELFAPAIMMVRILSAVAMLSLVVTGMVIMLLMKRLFLPLQDLALRAQEIAGGNMDGAALEVKSGDEIGILSDSFNRMSGNLKSTLNGLKESEDNYRSIFENAIEGIVLVKLDGEVITVNPAMARILGYGSVTEMMTAHPTVTTIYADLADRERLKELLLEHGSTHNFEVPMVSKSGEIVWLSVSSYLVQGNKGKTAHIESMVIDITKRKRAEKEREKLSRQLTQSQKLEAVGKLAGGVAHDFNNMLSVILGHTELALLKTKPHEPFYKTFTEIQHAADHSANLTKQLLAFARKQTSAPEVIYLNKAIEGTLSLLRRLIAEDIEIYVADTKKVWPVFIDPDQISQILTNLCVNAKDAISGSGRITIETNNSSFDESYCNKHVDFLPGDYVCLTLSDSGCGMDEETKQHIFEPFYSTKETHKGTGLGLATVYGIVKQNKGFIHIYSEVGVGTTFKVYFPRHSGETSGAIEIRYEDVEPLNLKGILLVEDELKLLNVSKKMLEELNCTVYGANSPGEAIQFAENASIHIDLLLTDVVMPDMNGRELANRIAEIRPSIPVLFMSGYTADVVAHKGVLDKGINFIHKPFSSKDLADKIREVFRKEP